MLVRYSGSIGAGAVITAGLIYWMQLMIAGGDLSVPSSKPVLRLPAPGLEPRPVVLTTMPPPPIEYVSQPTLPDGMTARPDPTTVRIRPAGPATPPGPPSPLGRPDGRRGPWIADSDLLLVARMAPSFPFRELYRGIEGSVVLEFTVTKHGAVTAIEVVESTHPAFAEAARDAVARWIYRPRIVAGSPVDVSGVRTEFAFLLED